MPPGEDHGRAEHPGVQPYVYVRSNKDDDGHRPLPKNADFYFSPAIKFEPQPNLLGLQSGQPVNISVDLRNTNSHPARSVTVKFYATPPAIAGGMEPYYIGTAVGVTVPGGGSGLGPGVATATCPTQWTPTLQNGAHRCLVVRCYVPTQNNPNDKTTPYSPDQSPWTARRNFNVLNPEGGGNTHSMMLHLPNPFGEPRRMRVHLATSLVQMDQEVLAELSPAVIHNLLDVLAAPVPPLLSQTLLDRVSVERADGADFGVRGVEFGQIDAEVERLRLDFAGYEHARLTSGPNIVDDAFGPLLGEIDIDGYGCGELSLTFERPNNTGDRFVVHRLVQATGEVSLGGYAVIWLPQG